MKYKINIINFTAYLLVFIYAVLISLRDNSSTPDTLSYVLFFDDVVKNQVPSINNMEMGIYHLFLLFSFQSHVGFVFFVIAISFLIPFLCLPSNNNPNLKLWMAVLLIASPFTYGLTANVIRQGFAIGLTLLIYITIKKRWLQLILMLLPGLFHQSAYLFSLVLFFSHFFSLRYAFFLCLSLMLSAFIGFFDSLEFINFFTDEHKIISYINNIEYEYKIGFRYEFWLLSMIGVCFAAVLLWSKKIALTENKIVLIETKKWVTIFLIWNSFSWVFISIPFHDRFFLYSWSLFPIILIYFFSLFRAKILYLFISFVSLVLLQIYFSR